MWSRQTSSWRFPCFGFSGAEITSVCNTPSKFTASDGSSGHRSVLIMDSLRLFVVMVMRLCEGTAVLKNNAYELNLGFEFEFYEGCVY